MKKACKLFILIALLTSCSLGTGQTTQQRYYALKSTYKEILEAELIYVQDCYEKDISNSCYKRCDKIKDLDRKVRNAFKIADENGLENISDDNLSTIKSSVLILTQYLQDINNVRTGD